MQQGPVTFLCESTVCTRAWFSDKGLLCQCTFEAGEARDYILLFDCFLACQLAPLPLVWQKKSWKQQCILLIFEVPQRCEDQFCGKVTFPTSVFNMQIDVLRTPLGLLKIILSVSNHLSLCIILIQHSQYIYDAK